MFPPRPPSHTVVIAHRGSPKRAPENTLPSFITASTEDAEWYECDVQFSADGVPFLLHDSTLHRTTNGTGFAYQKTWEELRALDAGSWFDPFFAGTHIPSLAEMLAWLPDETRVMLEIKPRAALLRASLDPVRILLECVHASGRAADVVITSFNHDMLRAVRRLDPDIKVGVLLGTWMRRTELVSLLLELRAAWYIRNVLMLTRYDADVVRSNNIRVAVFNATSPHALRHAKKCCVNAVITNDVITARRWFDQKGRS